MQAKLAEAKRQLGTLTARKKAADMQVRMSRSSVAPDLCTDAFAKFDRMREKVEMAEAEADAFRELAGEKTPSDSVLDDDDVRDSGVDEELRALKKKFNK